MTVCMYRDIHTTTLYYECGCLRTPTALLCRHMTAWQLGTMTSTLRLKGSSLNWPAFTVQLFVRLGWTGVETNTRVCYETNEW